MCPTIRHILLLAVLVMPLKNGWSQVDYSLSLSSESFFYRSLYSLGAEPTDTDPWDLISRVRVRKISFMQPGLIVRRSEEMKGTELVGARYLDFSSYTSVLLRENREKRWSEAVSSNLESSGKRTLGEGEGLVPDISLPVRLPGKLTRAIGEGGNLRVTGYQRISLGGSSSYTVDAPVTDWNRNSKFPSITMDQELLLNLKGTVGEKVHIDVKHNSALESSRQNQIRISYTGDEDEVIQSLIAGDTELSLPSSQFVGISTSHKGLFGIKAEGQIGNLKLTMIASKEKGHSEKGNYLGQASLQESETYDIEYMHNKFFGLELQEINDTLSVVTGTPSPIVELRVYRDNRDYYTYQETGAISAHYYFDNEGTALADSGKCVLLTDQVDYNYDPGTGLIQLSRSFLLQDHHILAVYYKTEDGVEVGDISGVPLMLKVIHEEQPRPGDPTWYYEKRNKYSLGVGPISEDGFRMTIEKINNTAGEEETSPVDNSGRSFLEIFGLDDNRDGRLDISAQNQYFFDTGILTLPDVDGVFAHTGMPFLSDSLPEQNHAVYNKEYSYLQRNLDGKYVIKATITRMATTFFLGHAGIIENSEVVKVDGQKLVRNRDYFIVYDIGQVSFMEPPSPTAVVTIDYEYTGLFGLAQKSLLGLRSDFSLGTWGNLGSTLLFESQRTLDDRVKVGEEAGRILVGDIDFNATGNPGFLTAAVDALPLVETDAQSVLTVSGEIAGSLPDPNVKRYGYIDDMESSRLSYPFLGTRQNWIPGSVPEDMFNPDTAYLQTSTGEIKWYNPDPGGSESEKKSSIYSDLSANESRESLSMMKVRFEPGLDGQNSFASIQQALSRYSVDFSQRRYLDVWVKKNSGKDCILNIDIGRVSEDNIRKNLEGAFKGRGILDTEDRNRDGSLQYDEDTGLDTLFTGTAGDDGNDDFFYEAGVYFKDDSGVNGTERNNLLDSEDMDADGLLDTKEEFYRFEIQLEQSAFLIESGSGDYRWKLYRVPLTEGVPIGNPDWKQVQHVRLWTTGADTTTVLSIHSLEIVGNSWIERGIRRRGGSPVVENDEVLEVSVKNLRENSSEYNPPHEIDPGYDLEGNKQNEQSLVLNVENLQEGHEGRAVQILYTQQDYTLYKELEYWIRSKFTDTDLFFRFGADSLNYYEVKKTTVPGTWRKIRVDLDELVELKQSAEMQVAPGEMLEYSEGDSIFIVGRPSLTNVKRLELGVCNSQSFIGSGDGDNNDPSCGEPVSDEFWIDDIRLDQIRKEPGAAGRITLDLALADLASIKGDLIYTDSEFHGLGRNRGSGYLLEDLSLDTEVNLEKILPPEWGYDIPIRNIFTNRIEKPKFEIGSDARLEGESATEQQTSRKKSKTTLSVSKKRKSKHWLGKNTVDRLDFKAEWTDTGNDYYTKSDSSDYNRMELKYKWTPIRHKSIKPLDYFDLQLTPSSLSASSVYTDSRTTSYRKERGDILEDSRLSSKERNLENSFDIGLNPLTPFTVDLSWLSRRDLLYNWKSLPVDQRDTTEVKETSLYNIPVGREVSLTERIDTHISPTITPWLLPRLGFSVSYTEDKRPEIQYIEGETRRNVQHNSRASFSMDFRPAVLFKTSSPGGIQNRVSGSGNNPENDGKSENNSGEDDTNPWLRLFGSVPGMLGNLKPVSISIVRTLDKDYRNLSGEPDLKFKLFGMLDSPIFETIASNDRTESWSTTAHISSGITLPAKISLKTSARYYENEQRQYSSNRATWKMDFPDVEFSWSEPARLPMFSKLLESGTIRIWYKVDHEWSGSENVWGDVDTETKRFAWNPLISFQGRWKNKLQTNFSITKSTGETIRYLQGGQRTVDDSWSLLYKMTYTMKTQKGIRLPFGDSAWKLNSDLKLNLDCTYSSTSTKTGTEVLSPVSDRSNLNIEPSVTYTFARNIEGSARVVFGESLDRENNNTKVRTIGLFFSMLLRF